MQRTIAKTLIVIGLLLAVFIVSKAMFYSPTGEVDSGLGTGNTSGAPVASVSESELPDRLIIPKLDIDTDVQALGVTKSGNMAAPNNFTDVSWYKFGTVPGKTGSAVMAGHVDNALGTPAIFYKLKDLVVGDEVAVVRADGKRLRYRVTDKQVYPYDKAPVEKIFNDVGSSHLNLITCQGEWVPAAKSAAFRLVVYTKLVED